MNHPQEGVQPPPPSSSDFTGFPRPLRTNDPALESALHSAMASDGGIRCLEDNLTDVPRTRSAFMRLADRMVGENKLLAERERAAFVLDSLISKHPIGITADLMGDVSRMTLAGASIPLAAQGLSIARRALKHRPDLADVINNVLHKIDMTGRPLAASVAKILLFGVVAERAPDSLYNKLADWVLMPAFASPDAEVRTEGLAAAKVLANRAPHALTRGVLDCLEEGMSVAPTPAERSAAADVFNTAESAYRRSRVERREAGQSVRMPGLHPTHVPYRSQFGKGRRYE